MKKSPLQLMAVINLAISVIIISSCSKAGNPAPFRSFDRSGGLPESWSNSTNIKWDYTLEGSGWSSAIISGDRVFITTAVNETTPPNEEVECPEPPATTEGVYIFKGVKKAYCVGK
jgi:hypothetical protein